MKNIEFSSAEEIIYFLRVHKILRYSKRKSKDGMIYLNIRAYLKLDGKEWKINEVNWFLNENDKEIIS